jgi:hypothetical protein
MSAPARSSYIPLSAHDAWNHALIGIDHAFAHTWESCHAMHLTTGWPTFLYVFESADATFVCPFAERTYEDEIDIVTPYGFSGFVGKGRAAGVLEAWSELARERHYVCGYIGLNPVLDDGDLGRDSHADSYNEVFILDLRRSEGALFDALSTNRRREIVKWRRRGAPLVVDRERLSRFVLERYADFMARRGAAPTYGFSRETLEELFSLDDVVLVGAGDTEQLEAVAVFAHTPAVADYLFGVSLPGGEHHSGVLVWEGARQLQELAIPVLNLGGGIRTGDGVADFKRRFGAAPVPLRRLRQVYDSARFGALCRRAGADPTNWSRYFPPYRAVGGK